MHVLIGSLVPGLTKKSDVETEPGKAETQDVSSVAGTQDPDLQESELEESETTSQQSEEPNEMARKTVSRELTTIFVLHSLNVVLGAIFFWHLQETSKEFVAAGIKVKEACSIDLPLAVYIGCPVALLASFFFRLLQNKFGPWRAIHQEPCTCSTVCPPSLTSREEQTISSLSDDGEEEEESSQ